MIHHPRARLQVRKFSDSGRAVPCDAVELDGKSQQSESSVERRNCPSPALTI